MDVAISGCGPAGLAAACFLADAGHRPVIYERFEGAKPVGAGLMLQPAGLLALERIGCRTAAEALGSRIDRFQGWTAPRWQHLVEVDYRRLTGGLYALGIHRAALFSVLWGAVQRRGIAVETAAEIRGVEALSGGRVRPIAAHGRALPACDLVVDASGANSQLRVLAGPNHPPRPYRYGAIWASLPNIGFAPDVLVQRYVAARHMIDVLPVGRLPLDETSLVTLFWSLKPEAYPKLQAEGYARWKSRLHELWPEAGALLADSTDFSHFTLARYAQFTLETSHMPGLVYIGDAAHSTSPQLGAGVTMAMLDAAALVDRLRDSSDISSALAAYAAVRRKHIRFYQVMSKVLTPLFQSDSAALAYLRDVAMPLVEHIPWLRRRMYETFAGLSTGPFSAVAPGQLSGATRLQTPARG